MYSLGFRAAFAQPIPLAQPVVIRLSATLCHSTESGCHTLYTLYPTRMGMDFERIANIRCRIPFELEQAESGFCSLSRFQESSRAHFEPST